MLRVKVHADVREFLACAEAWLLREEMKRAVTLESARHACADDSRYLKPVYWATVEDDSGIAGCAFRTPPYRVGITALPATAIPPLISSLAAFYSTVSGVAGPEPAASAFASAWTEAHGGAWSAQMRQRLYSLDILAPSESPPGTLRPATVADASRARDWGAGFAGETGIAPLDGSFCSQLIGAGWLYFWDDGEPRCMAGILRKTSAAAAIGIVYTPPALRRRGYATAAMRALIRQWLDRGQACAYAYADPASTVATALCESVGYTALQDTVDIDFS